MFVFFGIGRWGEMGKNNAPPIERRLQTIEYAPIKDLLSCQVDKHKAETMRTAK